MTGFERTYPVPARTGRQRGLAGFSHWTSFDAMVLAGLFLANAGRYYGLGKVWQRTELVQKHPILA